MIKFRPKMDTFDEEMRNISYYRSLGELSDKLVEEYGEKLEIPMRRSNVKFKRARPSQDRKGWDETYTVKIVHDKLNKPLYVGYCSSVSSDQS